MTTEQLAGILRALLSAAGGFAVGKGYLDAETATAITGGLVTILVALWSWKAKKPAIKLPKK